MVLQGSNVRYSLDGVEFWKLVELPGETELGIPDHRYCPEPQPQPHDIGVVVPDAPDEE
jgi:hypothetical protein